MKNCPPFKNYPVLKINVFVIVLHYFLKNEIILSYIKYYNIMDTSVLKNPSLLKLHILPNINFFFAYSKFG